MTAPSDGNQSVAPRRSRNLIWPVFAMATGSCLLACRLIPSEDWLAWFEHPLRTLPGDPIPDSTYAGVELLSWMLPIAGLCWILSGLHLLVRTPAEPSAARTQASSDAKWAGMILAVLVAGLVIRIPYLAQSLWYDEIVAFWYYAQHGPGPILGNMFTPANHTLQSLASWGAVTLTGGSLDEWVVRLPALVIGLMTTWPAIHLGRRVGGEVGAVTMAGLILFMPIAVVEGSEARGYAFMLFFGTSATAILLASLNDRRPRLLVPYAVVCALGALSHLVTVVVPVGHGAVLLYLVITDRDRRRIGGLGLAGIGLAAVTTLTLLAPVIPDLLAERTAFQANAADQPTLLGPEGGAILLGLGGAWPLGLSGWPGSILGLGLVCFGAWQGLKKECTRTALLLAGLPIVIALGLVLGLGTWIYARFLVFGLAFVAVAITIGLITIGGRSRATALTLAGLLLAGWSVTLFQTAVTPRQPIREAVASISAEGGAIASVGIPDMPIALSWYLPDPTMVIVDAGAHVADAEERLDRGDVGWIIRSYRSRQPEWPPGTGEDLRFLPGWIDHMDGGLLVERVGPPRE